MHVVVTMTRVDRRFRRLMVAIAPNTNNTGDNEGENSEGPHIVLECRSRASGKKTRSHTSRAAARPCAK